MSKNAYRVIRSDRRTLAIQIMPDGAVVVRCPRHISEKQIRAFVEGKADWIKKHTRPVDVVSQKLTREELQNLKDRTRLLIQQRLRYFAPLVGVTYGKVTIRHQRTRWGSCSGKGNLNFNCLLALTPPEVLDYVVVHELCHRKELNHSSRFWEAVGSILPDYAVSRKWLKEHGNQLISKLP